MSHPYHPVGAAVRADIAALASELREHLAAGRPDDARDALHAALKASHSVLVDLNMTSARPSRPGTGIGPGEPGSPLVNS